MLRSTLRRPWPGLLAICALLSAIAHATPAHIPYRDAGTGHVHGLAPRDCALHAGAKAAAPTPETVAAGASTFVAAHATDLGISTAPGDLVPLPTEVDNLPATLTPAIDAEAARQAACDDPRGQSTRSLANDVRPASRYELRWDSRDKAGAAVASGMYLVTLNASGQMATRKVLCVR
jgi:hypothetical protein